jgi:hydrogenase expression/formation protein HypC
VVWRASSAKGNIMCLAVPTQIIKLLDNQMALTSLSGVEKEVSLALLQEEVKEGDYVIVHVGYALSRLDEDDAKKTLAYFEELLDEERYQ